MILRNFFLLFLWRLICLLPITDRHRYDIREKEDDKSRSKSGLSKTIKNIKSSPRRSRRSSTMPAIPAVIPDPSIRAISPRASVPIPNSSRSHSQKLYLSSDEELKGPSIPEVKASLKHVDIKQYSARSVNDPRRQSSDLSNVKLRSTSAGSGRREILGTQHSHSHSLTTPTHLLC